MELRDLRLGIAALIPCFQIPNSNLYSPLPKHLIQSQKLLVRNYAIVVDAIQLLRGEQ